MPTTRGRQVQINNTVLDQADLFQSNGEDRVLGLTANDVTIVIFHNNVLLPWPGTSGVGVTDALVASGAVYFHEITSGFYSVRFRPNALGFWRTTLKYAGNPVQILAQDFDVIAQTQVSGGSLTAKFTNC